MNYTGLLIPARKLVKYTGLLTPAPPHPVQGSPLVLVPAGIRVSGPSVTPMPAFSCGRTMSLVYSGQVLSSQPLFRQLSSLHLAFTHTALP